ncbi:MAG: PilZ domain-containing protein [Acidobacteria bacterium]|nr:PilZ domain-containing protein [Acidobacteriota bacterium]MCB9397068.1 PilZ domain-containing protein [Acidobacteriota bacterium]
MGRERRIDQRLDWQGQAALEIGNDQWAPVEVVNVSRRGLGLAMSLETWAAVEEAPSITGRIEKQDPCTFQCRVCWSSMGESSVQVGVEVVLFEEGNFDDLLQDAWQMEEPGPEFNL